MEWVSMGIETTIIGMGVVFSVLILLYLVTRLLLKVIDNKKHSNKDQQSKDCSTIHDQMASPVHVCEIEAGEDATTIAIIMAAVSAASGVVQHNLKFTAIRRSNAYHSSWAEQGATTIINSRQNF